MPNLMLVRRLRRRTDFTPALGERLLFVGTFLGNDVTRPPNNDHFSRVAADRHPPDSPIFRPAPGMSRQDPIGEVETGYLEL